MAVMIRAGQSVGLGLFLIALIVGAIVYGLLAAPVDDIHTEASEHVTNGTAQEGLDNSLKVFNALPFIFAGVASLGLLTYAIYSGRV